MNSHLTRRLAALLICLTSAAIARAQGTPSLKDTYKNDFLIGTCLPGHVPDSLTPAEQALVIAQYSCVTPENCMKPDQVHPMERTWSWSDPDALMSWAEAHGIVVYGHTLVWKDQTPN